MRRVFILFAVFAFCGCAVQTHKPITKTSDQLKLEHKGVLTIKAPEKTFLQSIDPLGSSIGAVFKAVDSQELPQHTWDGYPKEIEVAAGEREIEYSCGGTMRMNIHVSNSSTFNFSVEPGERYIFIPAFSQDGCTLTIDGKYVTPPKNYVPQEDWDVAFLGTEWKLINSAQDNKRRISEYVPLDQSGKDWQEIVTCQFIAARLETSTKFMKANLRDLSGVARKFQSNVIQDNGYMSIYEWWHPNSGKWPAEHNITLAVHHPNGFHVFQYATKNVPIWPKEREHWIEQMKKMKLR